MKLWITLRLHWLGTAMIGAINRKDRDRLWREHRELIDFIRYLRNLPAKGNKS